MDLRTEIAVFGDALLEKGDPLGEMIALALKPGTDAARLRRLQREYERKWFGAAASISSVWEHGVLRDIGVHTDRGREFVTTLANVPAARFLRKLDLDVGGPDDVTDPIPHLVTHGLPSTLIHLRLHIEICHGLSYGETDLSGVWERVPQLEELHVVSPDTLGILNLPKLETLYVSRFRAKGLAELACARLPKLETLVLDDATWSDLNELRHLDLPSLYEIRAYRDPYRDDPASDFHAFATSPLVQRARKVTLSGSVHRNTFATLESLIAVAPALDHVDQLVLRETNLEVADLHPLTTIFGERLIVE